MYLIVLSKSTKFLLINCIPYIEFNRSSVGMELKKMDLNTQGGGGSGLVAKPCPMLVTRPHEQRSLAGYSPWDSPARILEWVAIS